MKKAHTLFTIFALALMVLGFAAPAVAAYPEKPIEFITHSAPGGGSDVFARRVADMIGKEKLIPVPLVVINKSGGGGAVAVAYVASKKNDPNMIFATTTSIYSTIARREVNVTLNDFKPICALIQDPSVFVVRADAPYKNVKEFIAAAKKKRKGINQGMGSIGSTDHIMSRRIEKATGVEFNLVSFKQTVEANTALLGGHVDFSIGNPSELAGQIEARTVRPIAVLTDERLPYLPNVPTLKEEGIDLSFAQIRGIWATKDTPDDVVQYLENCFRKLVKTEAWGKYLKDEMVLDRFMGHEDFKKWLESNIKSLEIDMKELGLIKQK